MKEHRTADTEIIFETFYLKTRQVILTGNSRNTNLARGSVFSYAKNYSTQISNQGAQADLKIYENV